MCSKKHRYLGKCVHCELTELKLSYRDLKKNYQDLIRQNVKLVEEINRMNGGK